MAKTSKVSAKKKSTKKTPLASKKRASKPAPAFTLSATKSTASGLGLKIGAKAPGFKLCSDARREVALKTLSGKKIVLFFYPKDMTPGCTQEACDFRDLHREFQKKNAVVFGVSKDSVESHKKFKTKYGFPFELLSDESGKVLESYKVWKEKSLYGRKYMGIERTTIVIDEKGKISQIYPKVSVSGHVDEVLRAL
jgi:peroxiredoxin Q/BCP